MKNKYELSCLYCGYCWEINYHPQDRVYCHKCKDSNIKAVDLARDKIDYYAGSPAFPVEIDDDQHSEEWTF